jgi:hypothetical protein
MAVGGAAQGFVRRRRIEESFNESLAISGAQHEDLSLAHSLLSGSLGARDDEIGQRLAVQCGCPLEKGFLFCRQPSLKALTS